MSSCDDSLTKYFENQYKIYFDSYSELEQMLKSRGSSYKMTRPDQYKIDSFDIQLHALKKSCDIAKYCHLSALRLDTEHANNIGQIIDETDKNDYQSAQDMLNKIANLQCFYRKKCEMLRERFNREYTSIRQLESQEYQDLDILYNLYKSMK